MQAAGGGEGTENNAVSLLSLEKDIREICHMFFGPGLRHFASRFWAFGLRVQGADKGLLFLGPWGQGVGQRVS